MRRTSSLPTRNLSRSATTSDEGPLTDTLPISGRLMLRPFGSCHRVRAHRFSRALRSLSQHGGRSRFDDLIRARLFNTFDPRSAESARIERAGRPRQPVGTHGSITTTEFQPGRFRATTRFRDWDGQSRKVSGDRREQERRDGRLKLQLSERMLAGTCRRRVARRLAVLALAAAWLEDLSLDVDRAESEGRLRACAPTLGDARVGEFHRAGIDRGPDRSLPEGAAREVLFAGQAVAHDPQHAARLRGPSWRHRGESGRGHRAHETTQAHSEGADRTPTRPSVNGSWWPGPRRCRRGSCRTRRRGRLRPGFLG